MGTLKRPLCISCFDGDRLRVPAAICLRCAWAWESRIAAWGSRRNPAQRLSAAAPSWFFQVSPAALGSSRIHARRSGDGRGDSARVRGAVRLTRLHSRKEIRSNQSRAGFTAAASVSSWVSSTTAKVDTYIGIGALTY